MTVHIAGYEIRRAFRRGQAEVEHTPGTKQTRLLVPVGVAIQLLVPIDISKGADYGRPVPDGLFRRFAALRTEEDYLAFASEFGLLGIGLTDADSYRLLPTDEGPAPAVPEPSEKLDDWMRQVFDMWKVVEFWSRLTRGLGYVRRPEDVGYRLRGDWLDMFYRHRDPPQRPEEADDAEPRAWPIVDRKGPPVSVFRALKPVESVTTALDNFLLPIVNHHLANSRRTLVRQGTSLQCVWTTTASSLLGELWLQCANWIAGVRASRPCARPGCTESIPAEARRHCRYCSDNCRARHYQDLKLHARRLHQQGISVRRIVGELSGAHDVTSKQVKQWLNQHQELKPVTRRKR